MNQKQTRIVIEKIAREEWGQILAILIGYVKDFSLAEDVLQDAVVAALQHWVNDGLPDNPRAWLLQTARRKAIDRFRRKANFEKKQSELEVLTSLEQTTHWDSEENDVDNHIPDERLSLIFTCCHPALAEPARVALTLKTLGGLTTTEIARAFLIPEVTMAQRIVRAKRKIKAANIPYRVPPPHLWPERLVSVLSVIYLIFNEGYSATSGDSPTREDLCTEAIRLGQMLYDLASQEPEVGGLLGLMILHDTRRNTRTDKNGRLIMLEDQDRVQWDKEKIRDGIRLTKNALASGAIGPYQIQAAISAVHAEASHYADTDWKQITLLYGKLYDIQPSPVVELNAIVAMSMLKGADKGLLALNDLLSHGILDCYQPFHAAHADLLRRAGKLQEASAAYRTAINLTNNSAEQQFLTTRLKAIEKKL